MKGNLKKFHVAIDGPGGAGKSTIAKILAKKTGLVYVDTGAMYRAAAYKVLTEGVNPMDEDAVCKLMESTEIKFENQSILVDGKDISQLIRSSEVTKIASQISAYNCVREGLTKYQRDMARNMDIVMDGRDIGTVILPQAQVKIFLTADPKERAKRRLIQLKRKGSKVTLDEVLKDIEARDLADSMRELNPLRKAEDAIEIDSTSLSKDEIINIIEKEMKKNGYR